MNRTKIAFACVFFAGFLAFADFNTMNVPDSTQIRRECAKRWFSEDLDVLRQNRIELHSNEIGQEFQIRLEETDSSFAVIVAPKMLLETDFYTENQSRLTENLFYFCLELISSVKFICKHSKACGTRTKDNDFFA